MNTISFAVALWLCAFLAIGHAQSSKPAITELAKDWTSIRISHSGVGSDYSIGENYVLLQRLDSNRVVLSDKGGQFGAWPLPVARALITPDAAQKIVDGSVKFYGQSQAEPSGKDSSRSSYHEPRKNHDPAGLTEFINIQIVAGKQSYDFFDDFADGSPACPQFVKLLKDATETQP